MADCKLKIPEIPKVGDLAHRSKPFGDGFWVGPVRRVVEALGGYVRLDGEVDWIGSWEVKLVARQEASERVDLKKLLSDIPAHVEILDYVVDVLYEHGHHSTVDDVLNLMSDLQWLAAMGEDGAL